MRTFPTRKSWGSRDRMALLENPSPPASPSHQFTSVDTTRTTPDTMFPSLSASDFGGASVSKLPQRSTFETAQKMPVSSARAIQFVPAYEEAVSPSNTHPLTSPEESFDREDKHKAKVTPSPSTTNGNNNNNNNNNNHSSVERRRGPRMARLASLFSSRAVVKTSAGSSKKPLPESPPHSEASSSYVGWPGTQDKRGATVAIESSYEDSDPGPSKTPEDATWEYSTPQKAQPTNDFHLTSALVDAAAAAKSPLVVEKQHRLSNHPMHGQVTSLKDIYGKDEGADRGFNAISPMTDPWALNTSDDTISDISTSFSKTSSAYFNPNEVRALNGTLNSRGKVDHLHGVGRNRQVAASVMRFKPGEPQPPTEESLAFNNKITPPHRIVNATNAVGYRGFINKTEDVPNLMDDTESDSSASRATSMHSAISATKRLQTRQARLNKRDEYEDQILEEASSDIFDGIRKGGGGDTESDVFDGVSDVGAGSKNYNRVGATPRPGSNPYQSDPNDHHSPSLVLLGGGLTAIQTSMQDFSNRKTASDFDDNLTNSDYDQYGFAKIPGFAQMASRGTGSHDRSLSPNSAGVFAEPSQRAREAIKRYGSKASELSESESGSSLFSDPYSVDSYANSDLNQYYIHPDRMKIVVKFFRKMSRKISPRLGYEDLEREEDATKAFALSEMRSRIMEKDIERGLERRGGTTVVDDLVLTDYNKAALRVRDAVVVSKAWRDGARPMDVINTAFLTRRSERSHYIPRLVNRRFGNNNGRELTWEEVLWVDDMELSRYRCHSIGPRHLRGFEMFTIGDCQSILLKLCHDRCQDLRVELNVATARQIEAEDIMKEEENDFGDGMMTEAEMTYLTAMEDVKTCSRKLVIAERSFNLVRDRIEKLVAKYETLLVKFDNDAASVAPSSVITYESSCYSEAYSTISEENREREELIRRAQRAEVRAELAAREAKIATHTNRAAHMKHSAELQALQQRLNELQSEASTAITEREHSVVLARAITAKSRNVPQPAQNTSTPKKNKIDDVKKRFRDRSAAKKQNSKAGASNARGGRLASQTRQLKTPAQRERENMYRQVGEEMFQHLDFYERSLKAVETPHN